MNNKLENILKRGMIETLEEAELFWDKAYIEIYRRYKHRERIHANLRLFESRKYYAQISYLTYERTPSSLLNQSMKFYGPKGEVSTYEELVEMKKEIDLEEYLFDKHRNVRCCFYNGSVDTEEIAKWFLLFADSIYSTGGNSINIRTNLFAIKGYYCELAGMKIFNEETKELQYVAIPGKIRYYSPDGEEENYYSLNLKAIMNFSF